MPTNESLDDLPVVIAVRDVLSAAGTREEAARGVLAAVGDSMGWLVGALWLLDAPADTLRAAWTWRARVHHRDRFEVATRRTVLQRGIGLPGRVLAAGQALWFADVQALERFSRLSEARGENLHAAVGIPITDGGRTIGVLEFLTDQRRESARALLHVFEHVGAIVGAWLAARADGAAPAEG